MAKTSLHTSKARSSAAAIAQLPRLGPSSRYVLRLYVTGLTTRSQRAINNIKKLCEAHLPGQYDLEIIDLYQQPQLAKGEQVICAPTLIKQLPLPLRRVIGDLSDGPAVLVALGVRTEGQ